MFLHLFVILFTGRVVYTPLGRPPRQTPPGQTPPQADTPKQRPPWTDTPRQTPPLGRHSPPPEMATVGAVRILLECVLVGLVFFIPRAYILVELISQRLQGGFEPIL